MNKEIKKLLTTLFIISTIVVLLTGAVFAERHAERDIKIWIDDFYIMSDVHPFIENDRTYVPIRFIAEELGYKVDWNQSEREVTLDNELNYITMKIGSNVAINNGNTVDLEEPVQLRFDRTFIPLRKVAELLGKSVNYNDVTKVAIVGENYQEDAFYHVKYYNKGDNVFITKDRFDFANLQVLKDGTDVVPFESEVDIFSYADDKVERFFAENQYDKTSRVPANKQIKDENYIESDPNDPLVGTWYGITKTHDTTEYYDAYNYITKLDDGRYHIRQMSVKPNGSQLGTCYYGIFEEGVFITEDSYETWLATGDFNYDWYTMKGESKLVDAGWKQDLEDHKLNMWKY